MGYIWQETKDNPTIPFDQIKGIKMTVYAEKKTLFTKSGEVRWPAMIHEEQTQYYSGVIVMEIDDNGNLKGKIGYYKPNGQFIGWKEIGLNWSTKYKFYLVRSRDPFGDIYLNMYILDANDNILTSESVLVNAEANHPYIMTELQANTKPYESVFEFVEIYPIDIVKLDGTVHRWKYVDDVLINQHSEEPSDNIITTGKFDKNGEMLIYSSFNVQ